MYFFDVSYIIRHLPILLRGAALTLEVSLATIAMSSLLAGGLVFFRISKNRLLSFTIYSYIQAVRNTPTLIKIFLVYYGLPTIGIMFNPVAAGLIALVLDHTAYIIEIYRAGIESVSQRQIEAAEALGFQYRQVMYKVVIPQAFTRILPALGNQLVIMVKDSSLLSTISVYELTMVGARMMESSGNSYEVFFITALFYLVIISSMSLLLRLLERGHKFSF